jgi:hypothetical protein
MSDNEVYLAPISRWFALKSAVRMLVLPPRSGLISRESGSKRLIAVFLGGHQEFLVWISLAIEEAINEHAGAK